MVPPADADGAFAQEPDVTPGVPLEPEVHDPKPVREAVSADLPLAADVEPPDVADTVDEDRRQTPLSEKLSLNSGDQTSTEQYSRVAGRLYLAQAEHGTRVVMVTSAMPGEGKTLTATNVALTLAESYKRQVLLIDADLRRPTLHSIFRLDTTLGLGDGLLSTSESKMLVRQVSPRLAVLPAGRPSSDPMAGLTSDRMRRLIEEARQSFDWVILDTPPVMLLPDAHLLASMVEGAVMVVRANSTPFELIKRATDAIGRQRILGVVLNRAEPGHSADHYQYYGYGETGEPRQDRT